MKIRPRIDGIGSARAASLKTRLERRIAERRMERDARQSLFSRLVRRGIRRDGASVSGKGSAN